MVGKGVADLHGLSNKFSERINPNLQLPLATAPLRCRKDDKSHLISQNFFGSIGKFSIFD
jgi:hypothetical protein